MARSRNIKPGFFKNEHLAELEPHARLLFAGLWCLADKAGRLEDRPKRIKAELFPYEDVDVDSLLDSLHQSMFIQRYGNVDASIIQVRNWLRHQTPHHKEADSELPSIQEVAQAKANNEATTDQRQAKRIASCPTDSLNSDSLNPSKDASAKHQHGERFAQFWQAYPKKVGKGEAWRRWQKLKPSADLTARMVAAVRQQCGWPQWQREGGQYIPNPATWLNQGRWDDEPPEAVEMADPYAVGTLGGDE